MLIYNKSGGGVYGSTLTVAQFGWAAAPEPGWTHTT